MSYFFSFNPWVDLRVNLGSCFFFKVDKEHTTKCIKLLNSGVIFNYIFFPLLGHIEGHLRYPHAWVWLTASQIFGLLFAAQKPEELLSLWHSERNAPQQHNTQPVASSFLSTNLDKRVRLSESEQCHTGQCYPSL